ncbi:putative pumilio homolog 7, chloroplastic [Panicum virgatum]|uniref:putative pumilio homolog 7, chloroplastic n=1 Tax=Panicum virgatum TaxID=38727 RepID=UPI0019D5E419|nr:putative pumilio homolog 7, chloroplastic [Panicum virgatum]
MSSVARSHSGCQFLVRMVAGGGAAAAKLVFEEVAGDIVRLMVHSVAHEVVAKLVEHWTDEHVTHVLQTLAASPDQILAVARNHAGSKILQTLIGRMAGKPGHAELFTSALARAGEHGVTSLVEHADGSSVLMKCLDTFSAEQNRQNSFFLHRDRHGCNVVSKCIDKAAGDEQLLNSLAAAVCTDAVALAEHGYGNFVVQHVMAAAPEARGWLHAAFRGRFVSLSTQAASSHVVQRCLDVFSPEQADEIVGELLIQMHSMLLDTISAHQSLLRDDRIAREVFRELRRLYR